MSSLYPDESYCTSKIGKFLYQLKNNCKCIANVTKFEDEKHITGTFTVYTVEITCLPSNSDNAKTIFLLQTRYKEMSKLHGALGKLHKQLYLRGTFPMFPAPKLLGSGDPEVIQERKIAIENVLNFVFDSEVLRKARILHEFVEKAKEKVQTALELTPSHVFYENSHSILDTPNTSEEISDHLEPTVIHQTETNEFQFGDVAIEADESFECERQRSTLIKKGMKRLLPNISEKRGTATNNEDEVDYLVKAGQLVATAQRAEDENAYELAFQCYKNAASSLIQGVQIEHDMAKRNAVRRKTAMYLVKADKLYRKYLSLDGSVFNFEALMTEAMKDPNILAFQCSNQSMKNYRFIGVLPSIDVDRKVLLVEQNNEEIKKRFVMKLLEKGNAIEADEKSRIFLPTNVPHMVQLVKFFETEFYIILLLEFVKIGRLWAYLSCYFENSEKKFNEGIAETLVDIKEGDVIRQISIKTFKKTTSENRKYRGKRLLFTVGVDYERVVEMRDESCSSECPPKNEFVICTMGEDVTGKSDAPSGDFSISTDSLLTGREESPAPIRLNFSNDQVTDSLNTLSSTSSSSSTEDVVGINFFLKSLSKALAEVRESFMTKEKKWKNTEIPECLVTHWTAQIVSFFFVLHTEHDEFLGDFNPEDILIDVDGNLIMTYVGKWYNANRKKRLFNGYAAPESQSYGWKPMAESDIWTIGAIAFELLCGRSLANAAPHGIYRDLDLPFPECSLVSFVAKDLLKRILVPVPACRPTLDEIRAHPFFRHIDWRLYDNPTIERKTVPTTSKKSVDL